MHETNKSLKEKIAWYRRYHPVSSIILASVIVMGIIGLILSVIMNDIRIFQICYLAYPLLVFWLPMVPIAIKTHKRYYVIGAILPFILGAIIIVVDFICEFVNIDIIGLFISITKEMVGRNPVILALLIIGIVFGLFGLFAYFGLKTQRYTTWFLGGCVVGKIADDIHSTQDGYTERPHTYKMKHGSDIDLSHIDEFCKLLAKNFIIINWRCEEESVKMWITARRDMLTYLDVFYCGNLGSWIRMGKNGKITVFVSREDYKNIYREVTYHTLCRNIAEKFEQSFIEFANGNKENSIKILRGDGK
ncbi:MAG: hypothetical protein A7316_05515 [Candidatus Altiarchaeales archaeon WOR_SM1_86-2]|nr:MAG: hypothetical protein A7316_05515 [Candidatus Altiarchaeales archaeon WOR_SM1_86-2]